MQTDRRGVFNKVRGRSFESCRLRAPGRYSQPRSRAKPVAVRPRGCPAARGVCDTATAEAGSRWRPTRTASAARRPSSARCTGPERPGIEAAGDDEQGVASLAFPSRRSGPAARRHVRVDLRAGNAGEWPLGPRVQLTNRAAARHGGSACCADGGTCGESAWRYSPGAGIRCGSRQLKTIVGTARRCKSLHRRPRHGWHFSDKPTPRPFCQTRDTLHGLTFNSLVNQSFSTLHTAFP